MGRLPYFFTANFNNRLFRSRLLFKRIAPRFQRLYMRLIQLTFRPCWTFWLFLLLGLLRDNLCSDLAAQIDSVLLWRYSAPAVLSWLLSKSIVPCLCTGDQSNRPGRNLPSIIISLVPSREFIALPLRKVSTLSQFNAWCFFMIQNHHTQS
jgi:hypothetical protein